MFLIIYFSNCCETMSKGAIVVGWTHIEINNTQMILLYSILGFKHCSAPSDLVVIICPWSKNGGCDEMLLLLLLLGVVVVSLAVLLSDCFEE